MRVTIAVYKGRGEKAIALETFMVPEKMTDEQINQLVTAPPGHAVKVQIGIGHQLWSFMTRDRGIPLDQLRFETKVSE